MEELSPDELKRRVSILTDQYGGISPTHEVFYIHSIMYVARAANEAFERFSDAVVRHFSSDEQAASYEATIVASVQEALTHAAALSRFFWPVSRAKIVDARAVKLRTAFRMDKSALHDRRLRNALEHFDERLDDFLIADPSGTFFPGAMVRPHALADDPVGQIFRLVDPFDLVFVILGQKYEFGAVWDEVKRIHDLALTMDGSGRLFFPERP